MRRDTALVALAALALWLAGPGIRAGLAQKPASLDDIRSVYENEGWEAARPLMDRLLEASEDDPEVHFLDAHLLVAEGREGAASRAVNRALNLRPDYLPFLALKLEIGYPGSVPLALRESRVVALAERILEMAPDNPVAHKVLGEFDQENYEKYRTMIEAPFIQMFHTTGPYGTLIKPDDPGSFSSFNIDAPVLRTSVLAEYDLVDRYDIERMKTVGLRVADRSNPARPSYRKAVDHFEASFESDPTQLNVGKNLLRLYLLEDDIGNAYDILNRMEVSVGESAELKMYRGLLLFNEDRFEEAGDRFEEAREAMDPQFKSAFDDLNRLMPDGSDRHPGPEFWEGEDVRLMTGLNERRIEHQARMVWSQLMFAPRLDSGYGWDTDRGKLWVRYGPPLKEVTIMDSESPDEFNLTQDSYFKIWEYGDFRMVMQDPIKSGDFTYWSPGASTVQVNNEKDFVLEARRVSREMPERSTFEPAEERVEFPFLVSVFRGNDDNADVFVPYGIQVPYFPENDALDVAVRTGAFVVNKFNGVLDEQRREERSLDAGRILEFDHTRIWTSMFELSSPPGTQQVAVEFETARSAAVVGYQRTERDIPDFTDGQFRMSDVMLAYNIEEQEGEPDVGSFERNGLVIQPAPFGAYHTDRPLYLYFEAYNLQPYTDGTYPYEVHAELKGKGEKKGVTGFFTRLFGGVIGKGVSLSFRDISPDPDIDRYQIMNLRDQTPGTYELTVRVSDGTNGHTVESHRVLVLE